VELDSTVPEETQLNQARLQDYPTRYPFECKCASISEHLPSQLEVCHPCTSSLCQPGCLLGHGLSGLAIVHLGHKERKRKIHDNCSGVVAFNHLDESALLLFPVTCCREG
jgi:hypothetical protein